MSFEASSSWESPAASTISLVFYWSNYAIITPINSVRNILQISGFLIWILMILDSCRTVLSIQKFSFNFFFGHKSKAIYGQIVCTRGVVHVVVYHFEVLIKCLKSSILSSARVVWLIKLKYRFSWERNFICDNFLF